MILYLGQTASETVSCEMNLPRVFKERLGVHLLLKLRVYLAKFHLTICSRFLLCACLCLARSPALKPAFRRSRPRALAFPQR